MCKEVNASAYSCVSTCVFLQENEETRYQEWRPTHTMFRSATTRYSLHKMSIGTLKQMKPSFCFEDLILLWRQTWWKQLAEVIKRLEHMAEWCVCVLNVFLVVWRQTVEWEHVKLIIYMVRIPLNPLSESPPLYGSICALRTHAAVWNTLCLSEFYLFISSKKGEKKVKYCNLSLRLKYKKFEMILVQRKLQDQSKEHSP